MARKDERRKAGVGSRKSSAKPGATRSAGVAKRAAPKAGTKSAAKAAAPPPPPPPKVKFRGRLLEHEPLARYTTYRLGGPARYFLMPADAEDVANGIEFATERRRPGLAVGLGADLPVQESGFPRVVIRIRQGLDPFALNGAVPIVGAGVPTPTPGR